MSVSPKSSPLNSSASPVPTYRRSSWQAIVAVKQVSVIGRVKRLLKPRRAVFANRQQTIGEAARPFSAHAVKPLANGFGDRRREALPGKCRQFPREPKRLVILDAQTHPLPP